MQIYRPLPASIDPVVILDQWGFVVFRYPSGIDEVSLTGRVILWEEWRVSSPVVVIKDDHVITRSGRKYVFGDPSHYVDPDAQFLCRRYADVNGAVDFEFISKDEAIKLLEENGKDDKQEVLHKTR